MEPVAYVASLHIHPSKKGGPTKGGPMINEKTLTLIEGKGILGNERYFKPSPRQVSLIDRSLLRYHEDVLKCAPGSLSPGVVRSNIETTSISSFTPLKEQRLRIGKDAVIEITYARKPCWEMDAIVNGLQASMKNDLQGVLARVISSGVISVGDPILQIEQTL